MLGLFLAHLGLALLLQQAEGQGSLSSSATLRDVDDAEALAFQIFSEFEQIVLANVVASEEDDWVFPVLNQPAKRVAERFDDGACAEIATADASHNDHFALFAQCVSHSLYLVEEFGRDAAGQMQPSEEIITWARAVLQCLLCLFNLRLESLHCAFSEEARSL